MTQMQEVTASKISTFADTTGASPADWWKIPLKLRQRWWRETDYGKHPPDDALKNAILDVLSGKPYADPTEQPPEGQNNDPAIERDKALAEKQKQAGKK